MDRRYFLKSAVVSLCAINLPLKANETEHCDSLAKREAKNIWLTRSSKDPASHLKENGIVTLKDMIKAKKMDLINDRCFYLESEIYSISEVAWIAVHGEAV